MKLVADGMMRTQQLQNLGQSLWLDNITRELLDDGTLRQFIDEWSITGLTSNPTLFDEAIAASASYDGAIREAAAQPLTDEELFMELALQDLGRAADLFRPTFDTTDGVDGWVSMEVSPVLVDDTAGTLAAAANIHARAGRRNLFVKIPGTVAGIAAIEQSIFEGVPVNVTLLFSKDQYLAAAEAYLRGIERRLAAGRDPRVASVASLFISRWDKAVHDLVPPAMRNQLGIAVGGVVYAAYRRILESARWQRLAELGARPQRLLWASTGTKDPGAPDCLYVEALAAPQPINTLPEKTLRAFANHGHVAGLLPADGIAANSRLVSFESVGIRIDALAKRLQSEGALAFANSWGQLLRRIAQKRSQSTAA